MGYSSFLYLPRARRSWRHPVIRIFIALVLIIDTIRVLSIYTHQAAANQRIPPPDTQRIYIASQHWNTARLLRDRWNNALLQLVEILGPDRVFVSIYESGSYDDTKDALRELDASLGVLGVQRNIILSDISHKDEIEQQPSNHGWVQIPSGEMALRRIPFLATLRNRVLDPLAQIYAQGHHFDTILFLNDVVFSVCSSHPSLC